MPVKKQDPLFGPAVLKLSFIMKGITDQPGFRVVYFGTLKELGLVDSQVDAYIQEHRDELEAHIRSHREKD
ncbi:MAG: hypothetical protein GY854_17955 [Deltaproteobacteria bacterium]|nr:hypothetical protein [Deltaproteobacteria bacterium]